MTNIAKASIRIYFIEMMGVHGSFDASVYAHFEDKENEGLWFLRRYGHKSDIDIKTCNICLGEALPIVGEVDAVVLAGSSLAWLAVALKV